MAKKLAQYKIIEKDLLYNIENNVYENGDLIPTELELSKKYNVSRVTVRRATDNLVANGFLKRTPGLGTTVISNKKTPTNPKVQGFQTYMSELGKVVETYVDTFVIKKCDKRIAKILSIDIGDKVYYFERIRKADDVVYLYEISYISVDRFPELSISYLENSKYDFFQDIKGIPLNHQRHIVKPRLSDEKISNILGIKENVPIIEVENSTYAVDGTIIDFTTNYYNPDTYQPCYYKAATD